MIKELMSEFFQTKKNILWIILLTISVFGFKSIESLGISKIISKLYKSFELNDIDGISKWTTYFIVIYMIVIGLYILKDVSYVNFQPEFYKFISNKLYERIVLSYQKNFENLNVGELLSKYSNIPWALKNLFIFFSKHVVPDITSLLIILVYVFTKNKTIFSYMLVGFIVIVLITIGEKQKIINVQNNYINEYHKANGVFFEKINNLFPIYINNTIKKEVGNIKESEDMHMESQKKSLLVNNFLTMKVVIVNVVIYILLILYIIRNNTKFDSELSIFYLSLYGFYFNHTLTFGNETSYFLLQYSGINSQAKFLNKLFRNQKLGDIERDITQIKFSNINFKYPETDKLILNNMNLTINNGDKIAIYGKSGSGKSTIFKLLMGFFNPVCGDIFIGDTEMEKLDLTYYRNQFAYVTQDTKLFDMSVIDNIKYSINVKNEDVYAMISKYGINPIYEKLEKGLNTMAGIDGNNLSGGQKQMVLLLRALLKKPKIYLFDEPTAALDPKTTSIIYDIIKDIDKTTIIISHDQNLKKYINDIYYLENSRLIKEK